MSNKISKAEDCSIRTFEAAMFNGKMEPFEEGGFQKVFIEYIDVSGLGETKEYELMRSLHNINLRIEYISSRLKLHFESIAYLNAPFWPAWQDLVKYGYRLRWDETHPEGFLQQLKSIDIKERVFEARREAVEKELFDLKKNGPKKDGNARHDFIMQYERLRKAGYQVDRDDTDMLTYALIVRDHSENLKEQERQMMKKASGTH